MWVFTDSLCVCTYAAVQHILLSFVVEFCFVCEIPFGCETNITGNTTQHDAKIQYLCARYSCHFLNNAIKYGEKAFLFRVQRELRCLMYCSVQTHLVTGCTAWLQLFSVVSLTVQHIVMDAVSEVHQKLLAYAAHKAGGVPQRAVPELRRYHRHFTHTNNLVALGALLKHRAA
jgi:hypothetical protein